MHCVLDYLILKSSIWNNKTGVKCCENLTALVFYEYYL